LRYEKGVLIARWKELVGYHDKAIAFVETQDIKITKLYSYFRDESVVLTPICKLSGADILPPVRYDFRS
jgi:hypothetical protein